MTHKEWVEKEVGKRIFDGLDDEVYDVYYKGMHNYNMGVYDVDKWAWLNTLFGYDIGAERALSIITWYDDNGMDVLQLEAEDKETVENVSRFELGLHFNFNGWAKETPKRISYRWPDYL